MRIRTQTQIMPHEHKHDYAQMSEAESKVNDSNKRLSKQTGFGKKRNPLQPSFH